MELSNDDSDGNENIKKINNELRKANQQHMHQAFCTLL